MNVTLKGIEYSTGKLDAFQQWHVVRRLAPILGQLTRSLKESDNLTKENLVGLAIGPLADAISKMSDDDSNYIMRTCLSVCQRKMDNGGFANIQTPQGQMMYPINDLETLLGLTATVIQENLGSFFLGEEQELPQGPK